MSTCSKTFVYRLWKRFRVGLIIIVDLISSSNRFSSRNSYKEHTKCVTEQEKYGGANYSAPTNMNKGEKKQNQWFEIVQSAINQNTGSNQAKILLKKLQYYPNTPRKRAKFIVNLHIFFTLNDSIFFFRLEFHQQFDQRFSPTCCRRGLVDSRRSSS